MFQDLFLTKHYKTQRMHQPYFISQGVLCIILLLLPVHAKGQEPRDTLSGSSSTFQCKQLILPASLVAAGSLGLYTGAFKSVNRHIHDEMEHWSHGHTCPADEWLRFLPIASYLGLGFITSEPQLSFQERTAVTATALLSMGILVKGSKTLISETRPDLSDNHSFPSGHTATAFLGAELVRIEYGTAYAIGAYSIATGVAVLRLYNGRHWLGDVIAGAGVGILSARIGYWLLPMNRKLFKLRSTTKNTVTLLPTFDSSTQTFGIALAAQFK